MELKRKIKDTLGIRFTESKNEEIKELREQVNVLMEQLKTANENINNINTMLMGYTELNKNVCNNNNRLDSIETNIELYKTKLSILERNSKNKNNGVSPKEEETLLKEVRDISNESDTYSKIDYFDFENYFRGSTQQIYKSQKQYLPYFKGKKNVVDLGCGRGEFLEMLKDNNIQAEGVDFYEEFVEMCNMKGVKATKGDAIEFLQRKTSVDGIFAEQLIEHISVNELVTLCELAYEKLEVGGYIVLETPNPTSLSMFTNAFYIDPSHNKPVHPHTLTYIMKKAGFKDVEIIYTESSKPPMSIPKLRIDDASDFNDAIEMMNNLLFGSQDYAIVARR